MTQTRILTAAPAMAGIGRIPSFAGPRVCFEPEGKGAADPAPNTETASQDTPKSEETPAAEPKTPETPADDTKDTKDEKPKPTDNEAKLLAEVMEKKGKIKELQEQLDRFKDIDPDAVKTLLQEKRDAEKAAAEKAGDFDRVKQMMADDFAKQIKERDDALASVKTDYETRIQALEQKLGQAEAVINDLTVGSAFDNSEFINKELVLTPSKARVIYGAYFDVDDGKVTAFDKPRGAEGRTKLVGADGNMIGFEDALKRLVDGDPERERLVKSSLKSGARSGTDPNAKAAPDTKELHGMSRIASALAARRAAKK